MFKILKKEELSPSVYSMDIEAPRVAKKCLAGQFIILRVDEEGERIPLTIANFDREKGIINIVFQVIGASTMALAAKEAGESIVDFAGPLGQPSEIKKFDGTVVVVGGGIGVAPTFPIARAMKEAGNKVIAIMGAKTKDILIMEKEMSEVTDEMFPRHQGFCHLCGAGTREPWRKDCPDYGYRPGYHDEERGRCYA